MHWQWFFFFFLICNAMPTLSFEFQTSTPKRHPLQKLQSPKHTLPATGLKSQHISLPSVISFVLGIIIDFHNWPLGSLFFLFLWFKFLLLCFKSTSKELTLEILSPYHLPPTPSKKKKKQNRIPGPHTLSLSLYLWPHCVAPNVPCNFQEF